MSLARGANCDFTRFKTIGVESSAGLEIASTRGFRGPRDAKSVVTKAIIKALKATLEMDG